MTVDYDSLDKLMAACAVLDSHNVPWAAASAREHNPFGDDCVVYRLFVPQEAAA